MQPICPHTISIQSSKPSHSYPIIRLPRKFRELAGSHADIYQTVHDGMLASLVVADKEVDNCCATSQDKRFENRLSTIESQIAELKSLILQNGINNDAYKENKKAKYKIRTRVVASTVLSINPKTGLVYDSSAEAHACSRADFTEKGCHHSDNQSLASLVLEFTKQELTSYTEFRVAGISKASIPWMKRCSKTFWNATKERVLT